MPSLFSVTIARPGYDTVAAGPYRSPEFAALVAHEAGQTLDGYPIVDVAPHEPELLHLPGNPEVLPQLLAAIDGHPATRTVRNVLADAYTAHAARLRNAA
ncbi:hypothetical protein OG323_06160 [Streptomyces cyaneofuscatus]|uniref:hypothetical protein n=1 Tax=Streptomyces cyaneofuscatus TaxID=66883 RepID=UPI003869492B|nr:hypothetical protein OG323_06160 [Streptomyces cyaneofuscatus]